MVCKAMTRWICGSQGTHYKAYLVASLALVDGAIAVTQHYEFTQGPWQVQASAWPVENH